MGVFCVETMLSGSDYCYSFCIGCGLTLRNHKWAGCAWILCFYATTGRSKIAKNFGSNRSLTSPHLLLVSRELFSKYYFFYSISNSLRVNGRINLYGTHL